MAEAGLAERIAEARRYRGFHGVQPLPSGFPAVAVEAAALREGEAGISES